MYPLGIDLGSRQNLIRHANYSAFESIFKYYYVKSLNNNDNDYNKQFDKLYEELYLKNVKSNNIIVSRSNNVIYDDNNDNMNNNGGINKDIKCGFCHYEEDYEPMNDDFIWYGDLMGPIGNDDTYVHTSCLMWAPLVVYENINELREREWKKVAQEVSRGSRLTCSHCRLKGAAIGCYYSRSCRRTYHLPCILALNCWIDESTYEVYCPQHSKEARKDMEIKQTEEQQKRNREIGEVDKTLTKSPLKKLKLNKENSPKKKRKKKILKSSLLFDIKLDNDNEVTTQDQSSSEDDVESESNSSLSEEQAPSIPSKVLQNSSSRSALMSSKSASMSSKSASKLLLQNSSPNTSFASLSKPVMTEVKSVGNHTANPFSDDANKNILFNKKSNFVTRPQVRRKVRPKVMNQPNTNVSTNVQNWFVNRRPQLPKTPLNNNTLRKHAEASFVASRLYVNRQQTASFNKNKVRLSQSIFGSMPPMNLLSSQQKR